MPSDRSTVAGWKFYNIEDGIMEAVRLLRRPRPIDVPNWNERLAASGWWHSFDFPDGEHVAGVRSIAELNSHLSRFELPANLHGKRVLDVGTWDGWFAFELERRGAEVVAIDCWDNPNFSYAHKKLSSSVRYYVADLYDLSPREFGHFDIVLFFGVLYHLKHPLLGIERMCALCRDTLLLESYVLDDSFKAALRARRATMEFYETNELAGQADNWSGPNAQCIMAWCRTAGFTRVTLKDIRDHRGYITAQRMWPPYEVAPYGEAPVLRKVLNNRTGGTNFRGDRDEYVSCWFQTKTAPVSRDTVKPLVNGWGSIPISVEAKDKEIWQANFKLPPGLTGGFHDVAIRVADSPYSCPLRIAIDIVPSTDSLLITGACDGRNWRPQEVLLDPDGVLSLWVEGLPESSDTCNTRVALGGVPLKVFFVAPIEHGHPTQVNAAVPPSYPLGSTAVQVAVHETTSDPFPVKILSPGLH